MALSSGQALELLAHIHTVAGKLYSKAREGWRRSRETLKTFLLYFRQQKLKARQRNKEEWLQHFQSSAELALGLLTWGPEKNNQAKQSQFIFASKKEEELDKEQGMEVSDHRI